MKALPKILLALAAVAALSVQPAQAYMVTLEQVGANVVATGSGPINLTGLTFVISTVLNAQINPGVAAIGTGPAFPVAGDLYNGLSGPTSFGSGLTTVPSSGSGDTVGIGGKVGRLVVPGGYVSGTALSDTSTYDNATFKSLGLTPGTYVWTWGTGLPNQNFTLVIGRGTVPDAGSTVSLLGFALLGLAALRRKLGC